MFTKTKIDHEVGLLRHIFISDQGSKTTTANHHYVYIYKILRVVLESISTPSLIPGPLYVCTWCVCVQICAHGILGATDKNVPGGLYIVERVYSHVIGHTCKHTEG